MKTIKIKTKPVKKKYQDVVPNPGETFSVDGRKFVALGIEQGGLLAVAAKPIGEMPFDVKGKNDWRSSTLRKYLNGEWLDQNVGDVLLPFTSDLTSDDGMKDYGTSEDLVFLLSDNLYRKYRDVIPRYQTWWWTITPYSCLPSVAYSERYVHTSGAFNYYDAFFSLGVVPSLLFNFMGGLQEVKMIR